MFLLFYILPLLLLFTVCAWLVLGAYSDFVNRKRLPGRRIPIRRGKVFVIAPLLLLAHLAAVSFLRPPHWRGILYEEMFDACRDNSLVRARLWLLLGASPDGASDYEAGPKWMEFGSHVEVAVMEGDTRMLRLLLGKGASPDMSSLSMAINNHNSDAVKLLLEAGANPRYSASWTAADQAKRLKFDDLVPIIRPYLHDE